jgi:hypothetical protein
MRAIRPGFLGHAPQATETAVMLAVQSPVSNLYDGAAPSAQ